MIGRLLKRCRRFWRAEDGNATVEFAITFPAMITIMLSGLELGFVTLQDSMLERAMDLTVREIRLGTGTAPQHDDIKAAICNYAGVLPDCTDNLRLEMIRVDPRNYVAPNATADCVDHSEATNPVRSFVNGDENESMLLRACLVFRPVFPTAGMGLQLAKDGAGNAAMTAASAFVQEPR